MKLRRAQAMVETLVAVLVILMIFEGAHRVSRMVAAKTLLDHAAARAARAKSVGFDGFMCEKSARVAMIPVAGRRLWPVEGGFDEVARMPIYLTAEDWARANAVLDYEYWHTTDFDVTSGGGTSPLAEAEVFMRGGDFDMTGRAAVESHYPFYMHDLGR